MDKELGEDLRRPRLYTHSAPFDGSCWTVHIDEKAEYVEPARCFRETQAVSPVCSNLLEVARCLLNHHVVSVECT